MPAAETILQISALGRRGDGVAETGSGPIFVPFSLPGDRVRARVNKNRAHIIEILDSSSGRIAPVCPHFQTCGGCAVQHAGETVYRRWKRGIVETALKHRGLTAPVGDPIDAHGAGRRRVTLHIRSIKGRVLAGYMEARSHRVMDLDRCPVLAPPLERAGDICRDLTLALAPCQKSFDIHINATETGLDCDIRYRKEPESQALVRLAECAEKHDLARVTLAGDPVVARRTPVIPFGRARVAVPPGTFLQATKKADQTLASVVADGVTDAGRIADLFCGIGPFALRLAESARILAVDSDEEAIVALRDAVNATQGLKPVTAQTGDLFRDPLPADKLSDYDAVIFDPPRAGAEAQVREIAASTIDRVVAVSCDPGTFARDAAILVENGFRLETVTPVDQFRYAAHVELVARFSRG